MELASRQRLAASAKEVLAETAAQEEVAEELGRALADLSRPAVLRDRVGG